MSPLARFVAPALILAAGLQISSAALAQNGTVREVPAPARRTARYLSVKVWEAGAVAPNVSVRVPTALVSTTIALAAWTGALDHGFEQARIHAGRECGGPSIRITGRQIVSLWSDIVSGGPADLVRIDDGHDRVVIRLE
ncbi:MAG TPA: hypothetical protein VFD06_01690 [Candidatus Polarisedimenticolia bacterium]|nr:hypothetical protein [Candidatus Polarisedimenticolia bacterium]